MRTILGLAGQFEIQLNYYHFGRICWIVDRWEIDVPAEAVVRLAGGDGSMNASHHYSRAAEL